MTDDSKAKKSAHAEREEKILAFWKEKGVFEKSLKESEGRPGFIFYEGPPTANGRPGIHHLEARAFKDAIPRYKTMRGFHVRRKGGWDTHGLPVELAVEKQLGLKSKKEIESFGIAAFNEKCKESVWTYVHEWEQFTDRMGYWEDLKDPYITYKPAYIEALWNVVKHVENRDLLYKDYKVVPWCPRCGTALSSHELAQGYEDVKDLSVYVKFKVVGKENTYLLAWTTTPWTLPGNVGLAVGKDIDYVEVKSGDTILILAKDRLPMLPKNESALEILTSFKGSALIGTEYEPLYPFLRDNITGGEKEKLPNAYKVYPADFVTTTDGTGIVHTAVMYGQDDFELGTKVGLPKYHLVNEDGTFKKETGFLAGKFVKDEATDVEIIKDLAHRGLLFAKEKYQHSYPHCWRCHTPLIYFARDSWYIRMSALRHDLIKENAGIHWEPDYIKDGRFGEWLREVKDWAISRERYWGTPLPVWMCGKCGKRKVVGSVKELDEREPDTKFLFVRHGESENNVAGILNSDPVNNSHLTALGREEAEATGHKLKQKIDVIFCSPFHRARETADIIAGVIGYPKDEILFDDRLREQGFGELDGHPGGEYTKLFDDRKEYFTNPKKGIETRQQVKDRVGGFLREMAATHKGKTVLIVSHSGPIWMMKSACEGLDVDQTLALKARGQELMPNAGIMEAYFMNIPRNKDFELDLHRPYIDEVKLACSCGAEMLRVKEVMDVWFDSGAMPFAQDHELGVKDLQKGIIHKKPLNYPADFICEAVDQTRGWFYTLHAVGSLMGTGKAYKNVICLGHILDAEGKKMSKHIGNVVSPWDMMDTYGADALRFWMYSVNQPGEPKNFEEKTVDEINKKVFNLAANVLSFYKMYVTETRNSKNEIRDKNEARNGSQNVLDRWILAKLNQLISTVTEGLDAYVFLEPSRAVRDFVADLSQWYLRRSRDRFKGDDVADKQAALATTKHVLLMLAKILAPLTPFFAEYLYQEVGGALESVHLEKWPEAGKVDDQLLKDMETVRTLASKGLEARMAAKINVRQPLSSLTSGIVLKTADFLKVVQDEVNVKEIKFDAKLETTVKLDTTITPELKEEGDLREFLRTIQDLRKEKGLTVNDKAVLVATEAMRPIISENEQAIKSATNLSGIEYGQTLDLRR